ncbi:hypothetical protein vBCbaSRXM_51 [Citromicrobium phage vB_CbaS-RXM]|nr:hypothetical protein vBCbaSRXM_51 [Citromicrobium phage vB_CbaS-RXM]
MNKQRRKEIERIIADLTTTIAQAVDQAKTDIEMVRDEEQDSYDNMPESFQEGEKGERAQVAIDALESAVSELEEIEGSVENAVNSLNEAME